MRNRRLLTGIAVTALLALGVARQARAADIWAGATCSPIDTAAASEILYNSGGAIANMSATNPAWVACPVRTPAGFGDSITIRWAGYLITPDATFCRMRLTDVDGSVLATLSKEVRGSMLDFEVTLANSGLHDINVVVRCELPKASPELGPQGITSIWTSIEQGGANP